MFGSRKKIAVLENQVAEKAQILKALDASHAQVALDLLGNITDANDIFLNLVGYERADLVGQHNSVLVAEDGDERDALRDVWDQVLSGQSVLGKFPRLTQQGETVWLLESYCPVLDRHGNPVSVVQLAVDVTDVECSTAQSTSNQVFGAFDRSQIRIVFDADGRVIDANDNFLTQFDYSDQTLKSLSHDAIIEQSDADGSGFEAIAKCLVEDRFVARQIYCRNALNEKTMLQANYNPIFDGSGCLAKAVMFATIASSQRLSDSSSDSGQIVSAMMANQPCVQFSVDGSILSANDLFLDLLGYEAKALVGQDQSLLVASDQAVAAQYLRVWEGLAAGRSAMGKFEHTTQHGEALWLQVQYFPVLDSVGQTVRVVAFAQDVTASDRVDEQLLAATAQKEAAQAQMIVVATARLASIAKGDLKARIDVPLDPAFDALKSQFNQTLDGLAQTLSAMAQSAAALRSGTQEIAGASDDLSRRTEQQAASLEQTAAALDELTATVARSSEGARKVSGAMTDARSDASSSGTVVQNAVKAMGEIEQSSRQISQIVGVIDEIAFQTNLLALNAGVEAARAGEAGRGFAVVASEVRSLAQRCGEAAKEIKDLIRASSSQVEAGVKLVGAAGESLGRIVTNIAEIDALMADIASSSSEQSAGLTEVNTAVNQMDQVTQQNAAMVEQLTAAVSSLQNETVTMTECMSRFTVGTPVAKAPSAPPRPQLADQARHKPAPNYVAQVQSRLARVPTNLAPATAQDLNQWDEF